MKKFAAKLFIAGIFLTAMLSSCNFSVSTAHIDDVKMCTRVSDNQCPADKPAFSRNTPVIFVSCHLKNAPENTRVKFTWYYYGKNKVKITSVKLNSGNKTGTLNLQSSLSRPTRGWPVGEYEVAISIEGVDKAPVIKKFSVQ